MIGEGYTSCLAKSFCQQEKQQQYTMVANQIHLFLANYNYTNYFQGRLHPIFAIKWPCSKWVHPIFWGHEFCWICMKNWRDHRQCNAPLVSAEMGDRCVKFSPRPKDCSHVISILSTKPRTLQDCFCSDFGWWQIKTHQTWSQFLMFFLLWACFAQGVSTWLIAYLLL